MSFLLALPENQYDRSAFVDFSTMGGLSLGTARALIWLSQLAYETADPGKIETVGRLWSLEAISPFSQPAKTVLPMSNTRGLIATKDRATIVAFAGTDPLVLPDLIADLRWRPSVDHIHEGFQEAVDAVWPKVRTVAQQADAGGGVLFFTGHSLGGALAVVGAERAFRERKIKGANVYTYGMPRVGTSDFVNSYAPLALTTYRFVHGQDIVPTVPPTEFGFDHVGYELKCESGGRFNANGRPAATRKENSGLISGLIDSLRRLTLPPSSPSFRSDLLGQIYELLPAGIGDHLPDRYWHALGDAKD